MRISVLLRILFFADVFVSMAVSMPRDVTFFRLTSAAALPVPKLSSQRVNPT